MLMKPKKPGEITNRITRQLLRLLGGLQLRAGLINSRLRQVYHTRAARLHVGQQRHKLHKCCGLLGRQIHAKVRRCLRHHAAVAAPARGGGRSGGGRSEARSLGG